MSKEEKIFWLFTYKFSAEKTKGIFGNQAIIPNERLRTALSRQFQRIQNSVWKSKEAMTEKEVKAVLKKIFDDNIYLKACVESVTLSRCEETPGDYLGLGSVEASPYLNTVSKGKLSAEIRTKQQRTKEQRMDKALQILTACPDATDVQLKNLTSLPRKTICELREKAEKSEKRNEVDLSLKRNVEEMIAPHTKPLSELVYDALDEDSTRNLVELGISLHLDMEDTTTTDYQRLVKIYRRYCQEHDIETEKSHHRIRHAGRSKKTEKRKKAILAILESDPECRPVDIAKELKCTYAEIYPLYIKLKKQQ